MAVNGSVWHSLAVGQFRELLSAYQWFSYPSGVTLLLGFPKDNLFYVQLMVLHVSLNAAFLSTDLISLYVCLEVVGLSSFLLIIYPRQAASSWIGLRYLFVTNTALLFYLIGVMLVYQATNSLDFQGLATAPYEAITLIF
ncbi:hypothetical protein NON20_17920 [Synechocystis sp. B12]|nr:hypothetical protein NON20_17920 [Synechocystis sp. B12]